MSVSYVVTVYNKATVISDVLAAIEAERRCTGGEIILVDDGSTDGSLRLLRDFADTRQHALVHSKRNGGVTSATNVGFSLATRQFLRFVDGDDLIVPGSTARLRRAIEKEHVDFAFGRFGDYRVGVRPSFDGADIAMATTRRWDDPLRLMLTSQPFIPSATLALRQSIARVFPLDEDRQCQDFQFGVRMSRLTPFVEVEGVCCLAPEHLIGRLSNSKATLFSESALIIAELWEAGDIWRAAYRRYAVRRAAGRARNYARRHLRCPAGSRAWLYMVIAASYFPAVSFHAATMRRIAAIYAEALARPADFP